MIPTVTAPHEHWIPTLTDYHSNLIGLQYESNHKRLALPEEAEAQGREIIFSEKGPFMLSFLPPRSQNSIPLYRIHMNQLFPCPLFFFLLMDENPAHPSCAL